MAIFACTPTVCGIVSHLRNNSCKQNKVRYRDTAFLSTHTLRLILNFLIYPPTSCWRCCLNHMRLGSTPALQKNSLRRHRPLIALQQIQSVGFPGYIQVPPNTKQSEPI